MGKTKDYETQIAEKVEALLQKMTLREKVGQVTQIALIGDIEAIKEKIRRGEVGSLILAGDAYAGHSSYSTKTEMLDELQRRTAFRSSTARTLSTDTTPAFRCRLPARRPSIRIWWKRRLPPPGARLRPRAYTGRLRP